MNTPNIQLIATQALKTGWLDFGLPAGEKSPPPTGWTGYRSPRSKDEIDRHIDGLVDGQNLGTRVRYGVVGIDIDSYEKGGVTKAGGRFITAREATLGVALPATWHSTRRGPQAPTGPTRSAIYFYRLPQWLLDQCQRKNTLPRLKDEPFPGVETVQWHGRYAVVYPSIVDGMTYAWYRPDGTTEPGLLPPHYSTLPVLPDAWVRLLLDSAVPISRVRTASASADGTGHIDSTEAVAWCAANVPGWEDDPNPFMQAQVDKAITTLHSGAGRYPTTRDAVWHLLNLALGDADHPGNPGGGRAIFGVLEEFVSIRESEHQGHAGRSEATRLLAGAVQKIRGEVDAGHRHTPTLWL